MYHISAYSTTDTTGSRVCESYLVLKWVGFVSRTFVNHGPIGEAAACCRAPPAREGESAASLARPRTARKCTALPMGLCCCKDYKHRARVNDFTMSFVTLQAARPWGEGPNVILNGEKGPVPANQICALARPRRACDVGRTGFCVLE